MGTGIGRGGDWRGVHGELVRDGWVGRRKEVTSFYNLAAECRLCCPLVVEAVANLPRFKVGTTNRPSLWVWILEVKTIHV